MYFRSLQCLVVLFLLSFLGVLSAPSRRDSSFTQGLLPRYPLPEPKPPVGNTPAPLPKAITPAASTTKSKKQNNSSPPAANPQVAPPHPVVPAPNIKKEDHSPSSAAKSPALPPNPAAPAANSNKQPQPKQPAAGKPTTPAKTSQPEKDAAKDKAQTQSHGKDAAGAKNCKRNGDICQGHGQGAFANAQDSKQVPNKVKFDQWYSKQDAPANFDRQHMHDHLKDQQKAFNDYYEATRKDLERQRKAWWQGGKNPDTKPASLPKKPGNIAVLYSKDENGQATYRAATSGQQASTHPEKGKKKGNEDTYKPSVAGQERASLNDPKQGPHSETGTCQHAQSLLSTLADVSSPIPQQSTRGEQSYLARRTRPQHDHEAKRRDKTGVRRHVPRKHCRPRRDGRVLPAAAGHDQMAQELP